MTVPSSDDLDAVASACAFLAHLFLRKEAGPTTVANLPAEDAAAWPLSGREEGGADTGAGIALLVRAITHPARERDLAADHARLFVGPGRVKACPWESVHRSEEGLTFEAETLQVRRAYARAGFQAPALSREPDDHIGLELAFVGELVVAALEARERGDTDGETLALSAAGEFVRDHLGVWGPGFADLVIEHAATDLYRAAGHLLRGALPAFEAVLPCQYTV